MLARLRPALLLAPILSGCPTDSTAGGASIDASSTTASEATSPIGSTSTGSSTETNTTGSEPLGPRTCALACEDAEDCLVGGIQVGQCIDGFCSFPGTFCSSDIGCVARLSGWETVCSTTADCEIQALPSACIEIDAGLGRCAILYDPEEEAQQCALAALDQFPTQDVDGNEVVVCGVADALCDEDGECVNPCESDESCSSTAYPVCDPQTRRCVCETNADCEALGEPELSACVNSRCGCDDDQDCLDAERPANVCTDGQCQCTNDSVCADLLNPFDGAIPICAPQ